MGVPVARCARAPPRKQTSFTGLNSMWMASLMIPARTALPSVISLMKALAISSGSRPCQEKGTFQ